MNRMCLVVLIGLPGSGKTTFCQHLMQMQFLPFNIVHLCYDDLLNFNSESVTPYKVQRDNILKILKDIVVEFKDFKSVSKELQTTNVHYKSHNHNDTIILCDDNHYYRSMRYKLFQIARAEGVGYCQIYFNCNAKLALDRNSLRSDIQKLPNDIILEMCCRLEVPNILEHQWEKNTLILQATNVCEKNLEMASFIAQILNNPVQPLHVSIPKPTTTQSKVHELDLLLRKHIKILMSSSENKNNILAKSLNDKRKEILVLFQKDFASGLPDIDPEKYLEKLDKVLLARKEFS